METKLRITISHEVNHEYHLENTNNTEKHRDVEVYLDGMFVHSFDNLLSAIGHCLDKTNWDKDIGYVTRNRS
ncbi:hypothetical protein LCGC14_0375860 [marine sediment metagenome]|uniref:Uncharacterized protein n=1 Tax=marine sediment metagenome TaxID=412755 RepID=A0A0F9WCG7_9ZZZZ